MKQGRGKKNSYFMPCCLTHDVKKNEKGELVGDSTEKAIVNFALEKGYDFDSSEQTYPAEGKLPFDSDRMRMSTLHRHENNGYW